MAQQTINHGTVAGDGTGESPFTGMQKINANFTELYSRMGTAESNINLKAPLNNPTFTGTVNGITKAMVGLSNVDNVADANKPVSTPQATAIAAGDNQRLKVNDIYGDFVSSGLSTPVPINSLDGTLSTGVAYVDGTRTTLGSASTYTYLALRDTYVDIDSAGAIYRTAVVNGNAEPALTAGRLRLEKVITDGSKITAVTAMAPRIVKGHPGTVTTDSSGNTVLMGADENYAAIPVDNNGKAILTGGGGHLREPHAARGGLGDILVAWDIAPSSTTSASRITDFSMLCPDPDYSSYIAKLDGTDAAGEIYQHTPGSAISMAGVNSIGFWAMAPERPSGEHYTPIKIMLASTAWTVFGYAEFAVRADGLWRYYVAPMNCFLASGGWLSTNDIAEIRIREGDQVDGRTVLATGESFYIGPIRKNPRGRAVGMIRFDDNIDHLYSTPVAINAFTGDSGVSIAAGSYTCLDLVEAFGFKANAYVLTDFIGQLGFETEAGLRALQDTYGWDIAFQAKANPVGISNSGVRLLGPLGYGLVPIGGVASVDTAANTITCSAAHGVLTTGNVAGRVQPFPVEFIGTNLPAPLVTGTKYYLSATSTTVFKIHTTAMGSVTAADIVDLTSTGTAANFGVRYWGSANDYTAILAEFQNGQAAMQTMGFKAYEHYALNQGAWDIYTEKAAIEAIFKTVWSTGLGDAVTDGGGWRIAAYDCAFDVQGSATPTTFGTAGASYASWINIPSAIQTDGSPTADNARAYVRLLAAYGLVGGNFHHALTIGNAPILLAYLDELKVQSDRGLLDVMTITEFQKRVEASV